MRSKLVTSGLVALLVLGCAGLGLVFGSSPSGNSPAASGGNGKTESSTTNSGTPPKVVVRVTTSNDYFGNPSVSNVNGTYVVQGLNPELLAGAAPLSVEFTFTLLTKTPVLFGHAPFYTLFTNSSGLGQTYLPQGNYSAAASASSFNYTTTIGMYQNTTTFLDLSLTPSLEGVSALSVSNSDGNLGVEQNARISAVVAGTFHYSPDTSYELVGDSGSQATLGVVRIPVEIMGSYTAVQGTWVVMKPIAAYPSVPPNDLALMQYLINSTVTYSSD